VRYYPIHLELQGKKVVVIGAGSIALQKIEGLLQAGAQVRVIAPEVCEKVAKLAQEEKIHLEKRVYKKGDLKGAFLVFGATRQASLHQLIHQEAKAGKILFNAVDQADECDFIVPARLSRGNLLIAISSGLPFLSKMLRKYLEKKFPPSWGEFVLKLSLLRKKILAQGKGEALAAFFETRGEELMPLLLKNHWNEFEEIIKQEFDLKDL